MTRALAILSALALLTLTPAHAEPAGEVDLPMQLRGPMPAVEVTVNGKGPYLFAIDTGAQGQARVDSSLVEALGLQPTGEARGSDGSGKSARAMAMVHLDSIGVGGLVFRNVTALARDYNVSPNLPHIDGILGFGLFADHLLTLDFPGKRVRIESGTLAGAKDSHAIAFDSTRGIPIVTLHVGSSVVPAHIDSGNVGGFVLPTALVEKMTLESAPRVIGRARTVTSEFEIKEAHLKESIGLAGYDFASPTVVFPAVSEDANVGSRVLADFAVTFDQRHNLVRFVRR